MKTNQHYLVKRLVDVLKTTEDATSHSSQLKNVYLDPDCQNWVPVSYAVYILLSAQVCTKTVPSMKFEHIQNFDASERKHVKMLQVLAAVSTLLKHTIMPNYFTELSLLEGQIYNEFRGAISQKLKKKYFDSAII